MGRDWLQHVNCKLDWPQLLQVQSTHKHPYIAVLNCHPDVFKDEMGCNQGTSAKFHIKEGARPRFCKARTVPYALKTKVERNWNASIEHDDVIEPVQFSNWAAPIVPIMKCNRAVRICGDYKLTVNQAAETDTYPLLADNWQTVRILSWRKNSWI